MADLEAQELRRSSRAVNKPDSYAERTESLLDQSPEATEISGASSANERRVKPMDTVKKPVTAKSTKRKAADVLEPKAKRVANGSSASTGSALATSVGNSMAMMPQDAHMKKTMPGAVQQMITLAKDERPEPDGQPLVWAESRQALCESLPYYRAFQSAAYASGGLVYAFMAGRDSSERSYMDHEIMILRSGGGCSRNEAGNMEQSKDHDGDSIKVNSFRKNLREKVAIVVIVGRDNLECPTIMPHEYNVLDHFQVTDIWAEKTSLGKVCYKYRLEKIYLHQKSWWAPKGSPEPCPDFSIATSTDRCQYCAVISKTIFQKWICLNAECTSFFKYANGRSPANGLTYNQSFIKERTRWPEEVLPPYSVKPDLLELGALDQATFAFSRAGWKGMVCPTCGRCNSRRDWDAWRCETAECGFVHSVSQPILTPRAVLEGHEIEFSGHALPRDECSMHIKAQRFEFQGNWRISTYELINGNVVTHFQANKPINDARGGPTDLFHDLQKDNVMGLQRHEMKQKTGKGTVLAQHFSVNYGMPYKYVVEVDSKSFGGAPQPILDALQRLTWAGKRTVGDGTFREFNELLAVGYFEEGKMDYHDDGEKELGPTIATLSLGGNATMKLRMKDRYYKGLTKGNHYNPDEPVLPGCALEKERKALNAKKDSMTAEQFEKSRLSMYKKHGKLSSSPVLLTMKLQHGDMVVMHGTEMQKYYEHSVVPSGRVRFALTSRFIKPELVNSSEHWKATVDQSRLRPYYGDGVEPPPSTEVETSEATDESAEAVVNELLEQALDEVESLPAQPSSPDSTARQIWQDVIGHMSSDETIAMSDAPPLSTTSDS